MRGSPDLQVVKPPNVPARGRRGRPPAAEPGQRLSIWLPTSEYDQLCHEARKHDMKLSALARCLLWTVLGRRP